MQKSSSHHKSQVQQTDGMFHAGGGGVSCSDPEGGKILFGLGNEKKK